MIRIFVIDILLKISANNIIERIVSSIELNTESSLTKQMVLEVKKTAQVLAICFVADDRRLYLRPYSFRPHMSFTRH